MILDVTHYVICLLSSLRDVSVIFLKELIFLPRVWNE